MKGLDRLQLKGTDFNGEDIVFVFFARDFRKRFANVAARDRFLSAIVQHLRKHFRRGRLAVGAGNRDDRRFAGTPAEFELADDVDLA